ncbi:MAG: DNA translocase FtsK [Planctomycetota bacterium]
MSESKKTAGNHTPLRDALGLGLVMLGALLCVSAFMFLRERVTEPTAFTAVMTALVESVGPPAILWLCVGCLFGGVRLFAFGRERGALRDAIGFVATALGLSILMGGLRPESIALGGHWGQWIGGSMSTLVGWNAAGVVLGLAAILIPAWVIWLRVAPPALIAKANSLVGEGPVPETGNEEDARRSARAATAARQAAEDPSGVTTAEADALLPDDAEREEILAALRSVNRNSASTANHAPSPYPADVRRDGGIPAGARPIETANEPRRSTPLAEQPARGPATPPAAKQVTPAGGGSEGGAGTLRSWSPSKPVSAPLGADADLARAKDARGAGPTARAASAPELKSAPVAPVAPTARPAAEAPKPATPQAGGILPVTRAMPVPIPSSAGPVGAPTWESERVADDLDEPELDEALEVPEASEPPVVDAYGTPLELVAALRGESIAAENSATGVAEAEAEPDQDALDQDPEPEGVEPWAADVQVDLDEDDDVDDEAQADLEDALEFDEEDAELDLEPQVAEAEAPIPALAAEPRPPAEPAEREVVLQPVQNSLFDSVAPAPAPVSEPARPAPRSTPKPAPAAVTEAARSAERSAPKPAPAARIEPVRSAERPAPKPAAKAAPRERTVVMEPQAAPSESSESAPVGDDLVFRSGLLFLAHKRVAVSMLQREFSLDFKQATAVLDQLQQQGLIGPYLGGQRRDILLTAEEWRARVGAAS